MSILGDIIRYKLKTELNIYDENLKQKIYIEEKKIFLKKIEHLYNSRFNSKLLTKLCILDLFYERELNFLLKNVNKNGIAKSKVRDYEYRIIKDEDEDIRLTKRISNIEREVNGKRDIFDILDDELGFDKTDKFFFNSELLKEVLEDSKINESLKNYLINLFNFHEEKDKFNILYLFCLLNLRGRINYLKAMVYTFKFKYECFEDLINYIIYKNDKFLVGISYDNNLHLKKNFFEKHNDTIFLEIYNFIKNFFVKILNEIKIEDENDSKNKKDFAFRCVNNILMSFTYLLMQEIILNKVGNKNFNENLLLELFKITKNKCTLGDIFGNIILEKNFFVKYVFEYDPPDFKIFLIDKISKMDEGKEILNLLEDIVHI